MFASSTVNRHSGGSRISERRGAKRRGGALVYYLTEFAENRMKMKELNLEGETRVQNFYCVDLPLTQGMIRRLNLAQTELKIKSACVTKVIRQPLVYIGSK